MVVLYIFFIRYIHEVINLEVYVVSWEKIRYSGSYCPGLARGDQINDSTRMDCQDAERVLAISKLNSKIRGKVLLNLSFKIVHPSKSTLYFFNPHSIK